MTKNSETMSETRPPPRADDGRQARTEIGQRYIIFCWTQCVLVLCSWRWPCRMMRLR